MRLPATFLAIATVSALAAACGGGSSVTASPVASSATQGQQLLHLRGYDITPDNWRTDVRLQFLNNGAAAAAFCNSIKGLSLQEVVDLFTADVAATSTSPSPRPNSIPVPGQTINPADAVTATQIDIDECNRITP